MEYDYQEIINVFKFSNFQRTFSKSISDYSELIDNWLIENKLSNEQLLRYMIVGFYIDFKVCDDQDAEFTTELDSWPNIERRPQLRKKLEYFNQFYGRAITSHKEYLDLISFDIFKGENFFKFVIGNNK